MAKKHRSPKKPRQQRLVITMPDAGSGRIQLLADGTVRIVSDDGQAIEPQSVDVAVLYQRESGKDKIITRGPGAPGAMSIDGNRIVLPYASVVAVDTNTRRIRGARVSCTAIVRVVREPDGSFEYIPIAAVEFHDATASPERLGWHYAIRTLEESFPRPPEMARPPRNGERRGVALVVDSELGALDAINRRAAPYFAEFLLPPDITMVYASSDAGSEEHIANRAIATCDKFASHILRDIEANESEEGFEVEPSLPFRRFRRFTVNAERVA